MLESSGIVVTRVFTAPRFLSAKADLDTAADLAKALKDIVTEAQPEILPLQLGRAAW